ncbi:MAG: cupin domain-containing protein, partial [Nostoc sp. C3-bin3]|nr:cupin domain-containing protein [Nostoc sp. C3-bin3]
LNFVVVPPDASNRPSFSKAGGLYTSLASVEETNGQFSLFDISLTPQSVSEQLMSNDQESQSFYVIDGGVTFQIDDQTIVGTPGTFVYLPQGTPYAFQNQGTSKARTLLLSKPASVPEPASTVSLLIFGLCGTASLLKRKHQQQPLV